MAEMWPVSKASEYLSRTRLVEGWVVEDRNLAAVRFDHLEKDSQGRAASSSAASASA